MVGWVESWVLFWEHLWLPISSLLWSCVFKCCRLLFYQVCLIALCFVVEQAADSEWEGPEYVQPDVGAIWCEWLFTLSRICFFLFGKYFQVQSKIQKGWTVDLASINFVSNKKKIFEVN